MNVKAMGLIYEVSKSAKAVGQVLMFLKEFLEKTFPLIEITVSEKKGMQCIRLNCTAAEKEVRQHLTDATLCVMYRELKLMVNNTCPITVQFPAGDIHEYKKMLGEEAEKGVGHALLFDKESMSAVLDRNSLTVIGELLPAFLLLLEESKGGNHFSQQVRKMILNLCSPELPGLEKVSSQFCMSARTLQRKLNDEGLSFRTIADEVKRDLSRFLQKSSHLKTQDIAHLLGYSESSAYLHAVKKWALAG
jgi:AraC-like DNA-binding protein